jgi:hypothetical protein
LQNKFLIEYITQHEPSVTPEQIENIKELNIKEVVFLDDVIDKEHRVALVSPTIYSNFEKRFLFPSPALAT